MLYNASKFVAYGCKFDVALGDYDVGGKQPTNNSWMLVKLNNCIKTVAEL